MNFLYYCLLTTLLSMPAIATEEDNKDIAEVLEKALVEEENDNDESEKINDKADVNTDDEESTDDESEDKEKSQK